MNKAFVREPESDGRQLCPRCNSLGLPVGAGPLNKYIRPEFRAKMPESAWFCNFPRCEVAYFNEFEEVILADELVCPVYPKDFDAPICACFGLTYDDVEADVRDGKPNAHSRIAGQIEIIRGPLPNSRRRRPLLHGDGAGVVHEATNGKGSLRTASFVDAGTTVRLIVNKRYDCQVTRRSFVPAVDEHLR